MSSRDHRDSDRDDRTRDRPSSSRRRSASPDRPSHRTSSRRDDRDRDSKRDRRDDDHDRERRSDRDRDRARDGDKERHRERERGGDERRSSRRERSRSRSQERSSRDKDRESKKCVLRPLSLSCRGGTCSARSTRADPLCSTTPSPLYARRHRHRETSEERRARKAARKAEKAADAALLLPEDARQAAAEVAFYSAQDNPFHDANLGDKFVWGKKREKERKMGMTPEEAAKRDRERAYESQVRLALSGLARFPRLSS